MSLFSRFTRKAVNTSRMETLATYSSDASYSADMNTKYQEAYKEYAGHRTPEIRGLMEYINQGVHMLNKLLTKTLNAEDDKRQIENVTRNMLRKLDSSIPSKKGKKYTKLQELIHDLNVFYRLIVGTKHGTYTSNNYKVIQEFQRNLREYNSLYFRNAHAKLNATSKASKAAANNASVALATAESMLGSMLNTENVKRSAVMKTTGAVTGMNNGPVAGSNFNAQVEALMHNSAAKAAAMQFPEVPTHSVVGPRGGRRTRRARRRV